MTRPEIISWKCLLVFPACLVFAVSIFAQGNPPPDLPQLEIIKLKWERQVRLPRNFDPSVISTGGTFTDPASRTVTSGTADTARTNAQRNSGPGSDTFPATPGRLPVFYVYSMKVRNTGTRSIEAVAWDYIFIDPANNAELGRHQFLSYEKVAANKSVTFQSQLRSPPTRVVQAAKSEKNHARLLERAVIQCVLYTDETSWRNPQGPPDTCALLKNNKKLLKPKSSASESR